MAFVQATSATLEMLIDTPSDVDMASWCGNVPLWAVPILGKGPGQGMPHPDFPHLKAVVISQVKRERYVGLLVVEDKLRLTIQFK